MQTFSDRVAERAIGLVDDEMARIGEILETGQPAAVPDHATYRHYTGQIKGLKTARELIDAAVLDVQKSMVAA